MTALSLTIYTIARIYSFILIVRIVVEMIASFSRSWRPPRWFALAAEPFFVVTDPPVKALRKLIPPLNLGAAWAWTYQSSFCSSRWKLLR